MVGRAFLETLKSVAGNPDEITNFFRILRSMSENIDPVIRMELMDHIPHIAMLCHSEKEKLLYLVDHFLPPVAKLLADHDLQVRKAAQVTLLVLMDQNLVSPAAVEGFVWPVVKEMCDQCPGNAVQLMCKMAPFLGRKTTERIFLARFCAMCRDSDIQVRKMCAAFFGEFCAVVGQPTTEEILLSRFVELCQDKVPGVRKACAEVIMSVSCACSLQRRKTLLAPVFVTLLWDSARWVRSSAFKTLGPFISTFAVPSVADLVYNENGELVLVNREGCEFRLNPNSDRANDSESDEEGSPPCSPLSLKLQSLRLKIGGYQYSGEGYDNREEYEDSGEYVNMQDEQGGSVKEEPITESNCDLENNCPNDNESTSGTETLEDTQCSDPSSNIDVKEEQPIHASTVEADESSDHKDNSGVLKSIFKLMNDAENESESSSECVTLETDLDDECHDESQGDGCENSTEKDLSSSVCTPATTPSDEWDFNSFQYWRVPIPDIELVETQLSRLSIEGSSDNNTKCDQGTNLSKDDSLDPGNYSGDNGLNKSFASQTGGEMPRSPSVPAPWQDIVPLELVEHFVSMTNPPHAHITDVEIALHCAFSLPAVALTLGRENWGFLRRTYEALAADMQWKVRRTVACSIHELAEILGEELTVKDLVPIYTGLIRDLDEVRIGALKHLADFVKLLPSSERKSFLNQYEMFLVTDNEWNWRFREEFAQQLLRIVPLYSPRENFQVINVAVALMSDKVAAVRSVALVLVTALINQISSEGALLRKLLPRLAEEFANSTRWERRQAFVLLCSHLVSGRVLGGDQFAREVLPYLLDLSYDRVPNVRLAVARTLASDIMAHQFFSSEQSPHHEVLLQVLKRLNNDKDRDVRYFADPRQSCTSQPQQMPDC